ncbi:hypothetical protein D3C72_2288130 [compost metagenome]
MPIDLDGPGDVTGLVQQNVLVGFDDDQAGLAQTGLEPLAGHESSGRGVLGELR